MAGINIDSTNALAIRLKGKLLSKQQAKTLIDKVSKNHESLWKDNISASQPEKGKWVRSAYGTDLGKLLKMIDTRVLAPLDGELPSFIFGGRTGMSNVTAAKHLLGYEKKRSLLALDIKRFFESVELHQVEKFYLSQGCSKRFARQAARFSCVPRGSKTEPEKTIALARGFSTSTRLAVWSFINAFYQIQNLVMKELRDHDPRIAIFIDDIGISASNVTEEQMLKLAPKIDQILNKASKNAVRLNQEKTKLMNYKSGIEHLGVMLTRKKLVLPRDKQSKADWLKYQAEATGSKKVKQQRQGMANYKNTLRKATIEK